MIRAVQMMAIERFREARLYPSSGIVFAMVFIAVGSQGSWKEFQDRVLDGQVFCG